MRRRVAALLLGALLLLVAAPVSAQVPDPGGVVPGDLLPGDALPGDVLPGDEDEGGDGGPATGSPDAAGALFAGVASAVGLELTLADTGLTIGSTNARVQSGPTDDGCEGNQVACAAAAGELLLGETATAFAPGNEGPNTATAFALPPELEDLLQLDIGVATAQASALPSADGDAAASILSLNATQPLAELAPVQDLLDTINETVLGAIGEGDPTGLLGRLQETLTFISDNLTEVPLLTGEVGPSSSSTRHENGRTIASAAAQGAKLVVVPTPAQELLDVGIEGLIIVEVGAATAEVSTDASTAEASADPAIARVSVLDPALLTYDVVEVALGSSECVADGTPLRICISLAGSDIVQEGANAAAASQGVQIRAFAAPLPELNLTLAAAEAGVSAAVAPPPPPPPPPPPTERPLPVTGFTLLLPGLALMGVGGASYLVVRRRA